MSFLRRPLSLVLAFLMLLGSVPATTLSVHAEEAVDLPVATESPSVATELPETTIPETTVAETALPEETETSVPEETTIPEETESAATVPEEAEPDAAVPEETVPESLAPAEISGAASAESYPELHPGECVEVMVGEDASAIYLFTASRQGVHLFHTDTADTVRITIYNSDMSAIVEDNVGSYCCLAVLLEADTVYCLETYIDDEQAEGTYTLYAEECPPITADSSCQVAIETEDAYAFFRFDVLVDNVYTFWAEADHDTEMTLYDSALNELDYGWGTGYEITRFLKAGAVYYLKAENYYAETLGTHTIGLQSAQELTLEAAAQITVDEEGGSEYVRFVADETSIYEFYAQADSEIWLDLYDDQIQLVEDFYGSYSMKAGDSCYLKTGFMEETELGSYSVYAQTIPDLTEGVATKVYLPDAYTRALLRFVPSKETIYNVTLSSSFISWYTLYDSNKKALTDSEVPLKAGDVYYLEVGINGDSGSGYCTVTIKPIGELTSGKTISGKVTEDADAWFRFVAPEDSIYTFSTTTSGAWFDLFDKDLKYRDNSDLMKAGEICYVRAGFEDYEKTGTVSVSVKSCPKLTAGKTTSVSVTEAGGYAWLAFTAPEENMYTFQTTTSGAYISEILDCNLDWCGDEPLAEGEIRYIGVCFEDEEKTGSIAVTAKAVPDLIPGKNVSATVPEGEGYAWFRFTAPEENAYMFRTTTAGTYINDIMDSSLEWRRDTVMKAGEVFYICATFEDEPSSSITATVQAAPDLTPDTAASVSVPGPFEYAWFRFTAPEDNLYTFCPEVTEPLYWGLYDSENNDISADYPLTGGNVYYLYACFEEDESSGTITFSVSGGPKLTLDAPVSASLDTEGTYIRFGFTAPEDGGYVFRAESDSPIWLGICDAEMEYLDSNEATILVPLEGGKTYYLEASFSESETVGQFAVSVEKCPVFPEGGNIEINEPGEVVFLQFTALYDHSYIFRIDWDRFGLSLRDSSGEYLDESWNNGGYSYSLNAGESYFVEVYFNDSEGTGSGILSYEVSHSFQETALTPATCTEEGLLEQCCSECGYCEEIILPITHSFESGVCTECGTAIADTLPVISMQSPGQAVISTPLQTVMFAFTPLFTTEYTIQNSDYASYGEVYTADMELYETYVSEVQLFLSAGETYILEVGFEGEYAVGSLGVSISSDAEEFTYPQLPEEGTITAEITEAGEEVFFTFIPTYDHTYRLSVHCDTASIGLNLFDHEWSPISYREGSDFSFRWGVLPDTLYFVSVSCPDANACSFEIDVTMEHSLRQTVLQEPTCTESGLAEKRCADCDYVQQIVLAPRHSYMDGVCTVCGEQYRQQLVIGNNSTYSYYSNGGEGTLDRVTYVFTPEYTESYTFSSYYTSDYYTGGYDTVGYLYDGQTLLAWDDDSGADGVGFEITYTLQAGKEYTVFMDTYWEDEYVPYIIVTANHTYEILDMAPATCTETGYEQRLCTVCGYEETVTLEKCHTMDAGEIIRPASCLLAGSKLYTCLVCGYQEEQGYNPYMLGNHTIGTDGICTVCGAQITESGTIGDLTWVLDGYTRTLTISGSGPMPDYGYYGEGTPPWQNGMGTRHLERVVLEEGVTHIGAYSFVYCTSISSVELPESLISIGTEAFSNCISLESIFIPASTVEIDMSAFACCPKLTDIQIDADNPVYTSDENSLIYSKDGQTLCLVPACISGDFTVPENIVTIASGAFVERNHGKSLTTVTFPSGVQEICDYALGDGMNSGTILHFKGDAPQFGEYAFAELNSSNYVYNIVFYPEENATWTEDILLDYGGSPQWTAYRDGIYASGAEGNISWTLDYNGLLTISGSGDMPEDSYGWRVHSAVIKDVIIEDGVTSICDQAFYSCPRLASVQIPDSVTGIGMVSFGGCTNLRTIEIPESVTTFGYSIFSWCLNLTEVTLPEGMEVIPESMFVYCSSLESIHIPESVTVIEKRVFFGCTSLKSVQLPEGLTKIGRSAFNNCTSLQDIQIPDSVTTISMRAFENCESLTQIDLPDNLRTIGYYAFYGCSGLTDIHIPASIEKIYWGAFAFCSGLTEVTIPDTVSYLGGTFWGCSGLKEVHIPDSVSHITYWTFKDCTSLAEVELPVSLEAIGDSVFDGSAVEQIEFFGSAPQFVNDAESSRVYSVETGTFNGITADAYYPAANTSWTGEVLSGDYGGDITWIGTEYPERVSRIHCDTQILLAGEKTVLTAQLSPGLRDVDIVWTVSDGAETCVSWAQSKTGLTVTAKNVTERYDITVTAKTAEVDSVSVSMTLTILPKAELLQLQQDGANVTGSTLYLDLNQEARTLQLNANVLPEDASQAVSWSSSSEAVATVNGDGLITFTGKEGTVKITATAQDGSKKAASVTIQALVVPTPVKTEESETGADITLLSGKSCTLQALDAATGKALTKKQITWSLAPQYDAFATVTAAGKLVARKVLERVRIEAVGTMTANPDVQVVYTIDICPVVSHLELWESDAVVNGHTLYLDIKNADKETCPSVNLEPVIYPDDAMNAVSWKSSSSKLAVVSENGVVTPVWNDKAGAYNTGTVTITATAGDGSGKKASVKILIGVLAESVEILEPAVPVIRSGKSLTLSAVTTPAKPTVPGVTWTILQGSEYAEISTSGKLKAKTVYEQQEILVAAVSKDGNAVSEPVTIILLPKKDETLLIRSADTNVTGTSIALDTVTPGKTIELSAYLTSILGDTAETDPCTVTWKTSSEKIAALSATEGDRITVTLLKAGKATITATTEDSSGKAITAKVTINGARLASSISIGPKNAADDLTVASGKALQLATTVLAEDNAVAANKNVTWSLAEGSQYAVINSSGKLTAAKDLTSAKTVTVVAKAKDGSGVVGSVSVTLKPIAQGVQIYSVENGVQIFSIDSNASWWVRSNTTLVWDINKGSYLQLASHVYPYAGDGDSRNADQSVSWTSSSPKIAAIDENGLVTVFKTGSVTITASANDGSKQKVSFKLNVIKTVTDLTVSDQEVRGGKSLALAKLVTITPADATNKKLIWSITSGSAYATISSSGSFKAKKVTSPKDVEVTVRSQDGGASKTFTITILP